MRPPASRLFIGGADEAMPGSLRLGEHGTAEVRHRIGDDLPLPDRDVDGIACGASVASIAPSLRVPLLLECRRVLRPGGRLSLAVPEGAAGEWRRLLRLAGFAETAAEGAACAGLEAVKRERAMPAAPLVSVLIPAFRPRFFAEALDSALAQTWRPLEVVVGDDSPGPAIEAIVRSRGAAVPIRYDRNPERLRTRRNSVGCFERAQGEFVKFLHDDDLLAPACVETLIGAFRASPDVALATSVRSLVDEEGRPFPDQPSNLPILDGTRLVAGHSLANAMIGAGLNVIGEPSTALFRRDDLADQAPGYFRFDDVEGHGIFDMVTWSALLMRGDAVVFGEPLSRTRIHPYHDRAPDLGERTIASIRGLQAAWLALGVFDRVPPDLLITKRWPLRDDDGWRLERARTFAPQGRTPEERLAEWRAQRAARPVIAGREPAQ